MNSEFETSIGAGKLALRGKAFPALLAIVIGIASFAFAQSETDELGTPPEEPFSAADASSDSNLLSEMSGQPDNQPEEAVSDAELVPELAAGETLPESAAPMSQADQVMLDQSEAEAAGAGAGAEGASDEALPEGEEESDETLPSDAPIPAGNGYLSFYEFGQVPAYMGRIGLLDLPASGGLLVNRFGRLHQYGPIRYGASLTTGVAYTDNVYGTSGNNRQGSAVWSATPTIFVETGNRANVRLMYSPSFQYYQRDSSSSSVNQTFLLAWDVPFNRLGIGGSIGYFTRDGVFADSNGFASQSTIGGNLYANYRLGHRTMVGLDYEFSIQNSDPGGELLQNSLTAWVGYQLGARTVIRAYVTPGFSTGNGGEPYITGGLGISYAATQRLQLFANVGVQFRSLSGSDIGDGFATPVFNAGAAWNPYDWLFLSASVFRGVGTNSFNTSQTQTTTGGSLGASVLLWRKLTLGLNASLSYVEDAGTRGNNDDYLYGNIGAFASYPVLSWMSANAFYNLSARGEASGFFGDYGQNTIGASLTFSF